MCWIALLYSREKVRAPVPWSFDLAFFRFIVLWLTEHVFINLSYPHLNLNKLLVFRSFQVMPTFLLHIHVHSRSLFSLCLHWQPFLTNNFYTSSTWPVSNENYWFCVLRYHRIGTFQIENVSLTLSGFKQHNQWETAACFSLPTPICMKGSANIEKNTHAIFF